MYICVARGLCSQVMFCKPFRDNALLQGLDHLTLPDRAEAVHGVRSAFFRADQEHACCWSFNGLNTLHSGLECRGHFNDDLLAGLFDLDVKPIFFKLVSLYRKNV